MECEQDSEARRVSVVTVIWNSASDAELNVRYWDHLCRRYYVIDRVIKIFLAVISSSTVAGWGFWKVADVVWKALYGVSTVTALALPILDFRGKTQIIAKVGEKWAQVFVQYDILLFDIRNGMSLDKFVKRYKLIREKHPVGMNSVLTSNKKRLKNKLWKEIEESRKKTEEKPKYCEEEE